MNASTRDWTRLGKAMRAQRLRAGRTQADVANEAGVSARTLINYEKGRALLPDEEVPGGYYRVEAIIGWAPGSVDAVLGGGDPALRGPAEPKIDTDLTEVTVEALALYPHVASFGRLCVEAGANPDARTAFDEAATRLLHSVPAYAALGARGLQRADLGLAALRPHGEGEPVPLDDVLRAIQAADAAESNEGR